jgi:hypothetical protein
MKNTQVMKSILITLLCVLTLTSYSQLQTLQDPVKNKCLSPGILHGGGGIVGIDFEYMPFSQIGIQAGVGLTSYGFGVNYHLKPHIRSSYISLQYWHQGFNERFYQSAFGPNIVFRGKKWLQAQIGIAYMLETGPAFASNVVPTTFIFTYGAGVYIPI